jgi:A/G-specific adenine glycosylase
VGGAGLLCPRPQPAGLRPRGGGSGLSRYREGLRALPGLGAYTAAAVAAIAFDRHAVVVDANVERVVARLFAIDTPLPAARPAIRAATATITPQRRAGDFAQAMMDLGATICTVKTPRCLLCPLRQDCRAAAEGRAEGCR